MDTLGILKKYWGFDQFRPPQEDIINTVLEGKDTLALLPTGGGKSVCFQVASLASEGLCLVISPLIALMKDQVENLTKKGIPALFIYSGMSFVEVKKVLQNAAYGKYKFLYVSPERLETALFLEYLPAMQINLLAVDEAHCISQWGYDFRPSYTRIAGLREFLPHVPVLALTASATRVVQEDICDKLLFAKSHQVFRQSFERPRLSYSVFDAGSKQNKLLEILKNVPGSGIVYCKSRRHTKEIADWLKMNAVVADHYHAGLGNEERNKKQEEWIKGNTRVMVCTNAFGMGIDKADVRTVVHYDVPDCLENYYQEAGRAGRDGKKAYAVLLYGNKELEDLKAQSQVRFPSSVYIKKIYTDLMNHLQVAAGTGEGLTFDFYLAAFTSSFKLNSFHATYAIKAMEQEGLLSFNEVFFKPPVAQCIASREELNDFENQYPVFDPILKGLLRCYEGITDLPVTISEFQLAGFLRISPDEVKNGLIRLNELGLIIYSPQKDKPQICLLQNRMYRDNYVMNTSAILERKEKFEERVNAIINYITDTSHCRSSLIADYFSASVSRSCGVCDNCINSASAEISASEFESISRQIFLLIREKPLAIEQLLKSLKDVQKEKAWNVVSFLQAEHKIKADGEGLIRLP